MTSNIIVGQITELIARGTFFSYILVFTLLPSILLFKEKAHAAIMKRKGKEIAYDDEAEDYNETRRIMKRQRHDEMMRAKAAEYGFDYDPNAPLIDVKQIKADMAARKQARAEAKAQANLVKQAKKAAKKEGVSYEEYLLSHPLGADGSGDIENAASDSLPESDAPAGYEETASSAENSESTDGGANGNTDGQPAPSDTDDKD